MAITFPLTGEVKITSGLYLLKNKGEPAFTSWSTLTVNLGNMPVKSMGFTAKVSEGSDWMNILSALPFKFMSKPFLIFITSDILNY